jgi:hypothetical protein
MSDVQYRPSNDSSPTPPPAEAPEPITGSTSEIAEKATKALNEQRRKRS